MIEKIKNHFFSFLMLLFKLFGVIKNLFVLTGLFSRCVVEWVEHYCSDHKTWVQISPWSVYKGDNFLIILFWDDDPGMKQYWEVPENHTTD